MPPLHDAPPSVSADWPAPSAYVCQVEHWCDPRFRNELANDLGDTIAKLAPSNLSSGPVSASPGLGEATWTGFAPTVEVRPV